MTYNILDSNLRIKAGRFKTLVNAVRHAIENFDQSQVWFVEDGSGDIACIAHCDSAWMPIPLGEFEEISGQANE